MGILGMLGGKKESYDDEFNALFKEVDTLERHYKQILEAFGMYVDIRTGGFSGKGFPAVVKRQAERVSDFQEIGQRLKVCGEEIRPKDSSSQCVVKAGITLKLIGQAENDFTSTLLKEYLGQMNRFLEMDMKELRTELSTLEHFYSTWESNKAKHTKANEALSKKPEDAKLKENVTLTSNAARDSEKPFNQQRSKVMDIMQKLLSEHYLNTQPLQAVLKHLTEYYEKSLRYLEDAKSYFANPK